MGYCVLSRVSENEVLCPLLVAFLTAVPLQVKTLMLDPPPITLIKESPPTPPLLRVNSKAEKHV